MFNFGSDVETLQGKKAEDESANSRWFWKAEAYTVRGYEELL
jgi:hypothetical protein